MLSIGDLVLAAYPLQHNGEPVYVILQGIQTESPNQLMSSSLQNDRVQYLAIYIILDY